MYYMLSSQVVTYTFNPFIANPSFCSEFTYELIVDDRTAKKVVDNFVASQRKITFKYDDDLDPLEDDPNLEFKDYDITIRASRIGSASVDATFTLRITNPCSVGAKEPGLERPEYCPAIDDGEDLTPYYVPRMPYWMQNFTQQSVLFNTGFVYDFGDPVNQYG